MSDVDRGWFGDYNKTKGIYGKQRRPKRKEFNWKRERSFFFYYLCPVFGNQVFFHWKEFIN